MGLGTAITVALGPAAHALDLDLGKPSDIWETGQVNLGSTAQAPAAELTTGSISPAPAAPIEIKKQMIVIDPGHGGMDPGALSRAGTKEKDVVLAFALALRQNLEDTGRYQVSLTRSTDSLIKLDDRVSQARNAQAALFIALHADKLDDKTVRGTTIYTVSDKASDAEAERLAQQENGVDKIAGLNLSQQKVEVASALLNLAQRESRAEALDFAQRAVKELKPITQMTGAPLRAAAFVVLKAPDVPSVLVELGYLSNPTDEALLNSAAWRKSMAGAITTAVDAYFATPAATASRQN